MLAPTVSEEAGQLRQPPGLFRVSLAVFPLKRHRIDRLLQKLGYLQLHPKLGSVLLVPSEAIERPARQPNVHK
jgi:hypothetical protein